MKQVSVLRQQPTAAKLTGAIWAALVGSAGPLFAGAAAAGPFGFDLESSVEPSRLYSFCSEYDGWVDSLFNFGCITAPKPHPDMEFYRVSFVEGVGVCGVQGIGEDIYDTRWGHYTRIQVDRIANQIRLRYGSWSEKFDDIYSDDSLWDNSEDWMMSILEEERYYGYEWIFPKQSDDIKEISVFAKAINQDTGYVFVQFFTSLEDSCEKAIQRRWADVF